MWTLFAFAATIFVTTALAEPSSGNGSRGTLIQVCYPTDVETRSSCDSLKSKLDACGINVIQYVDKFPGEISADLRTRGLSPDTPALISGHGGRALDTGEHIIATKYLPDQVRAQLVHFPKNAAFTEYFEERTFLRKVHFRTQWIKDAIREGLRTPPLAGATDSPIWLSSCHGGAGARCFREPTAASCGPSEGAQMGEKIDWRDRAFELVADLMCDGSLLAAWDKNKNRRIDSRELSDYMRSREGEVNLTYHYRYSTYQAPDGMHDGSTVLPGAVTMDAVKAQFACRFGAENVTVQSTGMKYYVRYTLNQGGYLYQYRAYREGPAGVTDCATLLGFQPISCEIVGSGQQFQVTVVDTTRTRLEDYDVGRFDAHGRHPIIHAHPIFNEFYLPY